jgi:hypothetical protein
MSPRVIDGPGGGLSCATGSGTTALNDNFFTILPRPSSAGGVRGFAFVMLADQLPLTAPTGKDIGALSVAPRAYEFRCNERQRHIVRQ